MVGWFLFKVFLKSFLLDCFWQSKILKINTFYHFFGGGRQHHVACGILVPRPETETTPRCIGSVESFNYWTAREVPLLDEDFLFTDDANAVLSLGRQVSWIIQEVF